MKKVAIIGAGNIGPTVTAFLANPETGAPYEILITDIDPKKLETIEKWKSEVGAEIAARVATRVLDAGDNSALSATITGSYAVISALPYKYTLAVAQAALAADVHYLDPTEDVATTKAVQQLAAKANKAVIPQCGLAPGFIAIVGHDLFTRFDRVTDLRMRVGALPEFPANALGYNLTWSTDGVIHEYCAPGEAIADGKLQPTTSLEECETIAIDGVSYEAFNTSGGLGTLCETLAGRVRNMNYRTLRYPGHAAIMKVLLNDLRFRDEQYQDELVKIFNRALPRTEQDVVVIFVTATGERAGRFEQETYVNKVRPRRISGKRYTGIQITTAAGICAVLDLLSHGKLKDKGFVKQEDVKLSDFVDNRFGRYYLE
ncbi:MAG: saccharopine dehydrogenase C-terminal domain-containing protein [Terricaulis sp.]